MRRSILLAAALVACGAPATGQPTASPSATAPDATHISAADEQCARQTFVSLVDAVNTGNEAKLTYLIGGAFQWLAMPGATTYESRVAVERLLSVSRTGQQWQLRRLDVNGRGWHGGIDFGVVVRRSGSGVVDPYKDSAGKGVLDCPEGRIRLFGLGD